MLKEYLKYKWIAVLIFSIVFFIGVLVFFDIPAIIAIQEKKQQTDDIAAKNVILQTKLSTLDSLLLSDLETKYQLANVALLSSRDPIHILSLLDNSLARVDTANLSLGEVQFESGEVKNEKDRKEDLLFFQKMEGKKDVIRDFMETIEKGYPLITIKSMEGKFDETSLLQLNFVVHVYPEVKQLPSLETPIDVFSKADNDYFEKISPFLSAFENSGATAPVRRLENRDPFAE